MDYFHMTGPELKALADSDEGAQAEIDRRKAKKAGRTKIDSTGLTVDQAIDQIHDLLNAIPLSDQIREGILLQLATAASS